MSPPTSVCSALAMSVTRNPKCAALGRSICTCNSGLRFDSVVSTSTMPLLELNRRMIPSEYSESLSRSGPSRLNDKSELRPPVLMLEINCTLERTSG